MYCVYIMGLSINSINGRLASIFFDQIVKKHEKLILDSKFGLEEGYAMKMIYHMQMFHAKMPQIGNGRYNLLLTVIDFNTVFKAKR